MRILLPCAFLLPFSSIAIEVYDIMIQAIHNNDLPKLEAYAAEERYKYRVRLEAWTPLHEAAIHNNVKAAEILLAHGADVNARDGNGWTPLHVSVQKNHFEISDFLVKNGASGLVADVTKNLPMSYARGTDLRMAGVLLRSLGNPDPGDG